jgi:hypothetical protein
MKPDHEWEWTDLRDFVTDQIEARGGAVDRGSHHLTGIFKRFARVWGPLAVRIARYVFDVEDGRWMGRLVSVSDFTIKGDGWFATPISQRLG